MSDRRNGRSAPGAAAFSTARRKALVLASKRSADGRVVADRMGLPENVVGYD